MQRLKHQSGLYFDEDFAFSRCHEADEHILYLKNLLFFQYFYQLWCYGLYTGGEEKKYAFSKINGKSLYSQPIQHILWYMHLILEIFICTFYFALLFYVKNLGKLLNKNVFDTYFFFAVHYF